jgi:hypothetical protein
MSVKKEIEINVNSKGAKKGIDEASQATSGLTRSLDNMTGGAISGFKGVVSGAKKGVMAMKSLKVAIAATGIGLLLVAITALTSYFTKTQRGADKLSQALKGIGAVVDVLVDRISTFGEGLFKILSGDFSEGVDILKGTFKGLGEEIRNEAKAAIDLEKAQQALEDRQISLIKVNAQRRASIEKLRLAAEDTTKTDKERADALRAAAKLQNEIADDEISIAKERARIVRERVALGESSRDDLQEQAEAEARVIELEAERDRRLKSLQTRLNAFTKGTEENTEATDANAEALKKLNEEIAKRDERLEQESAQLQEKLASEYDAILQAQNDAQTNEINAVEDKYNRLLENAEQFGFDEIELNRLKAEEINKINKKYDDEDSARKKQKAADDKAVNDATISAIAGTLGSLSQLAGKEAASGKALSAAQAVINTYTGATKALAQGGVAGPIAAAGVIASGIASIRQIYATKLPATTGGGGGGSAPRPQISAPSISPRLSLNTQVADLGNQITESLSKSPVRAYVVNQDVQSAAKMDRKIRETATIG